MKDEKLESAVKAVTLILDRFDLTIKEARTVTREVIRRLEAMADAASVRDFKGYQIDGHGEAVSEERIKPIKEDIYETTA